MKNKTLILYAILYLICPLEINSLESLEYFKKIRKFLDVSVSEESKMIKGLNNQKRIKKEKELIYIASNVDAARVINKLSSEKILDMEQLIKIFLYE